MKNRLIYARCSHCCIDWSRAVGGQFFSNLSNASFTRATEGEGLTFRHLLGGVIATLHRRRCLEATTWRSEIFLQLRQLGLDGSRPFRWSPCGPMRLAGLHAVKHESVRHRKRAAFQEMSNRCDRSSPAVYYFEDSPQRLTRASRLTGKTQICIQRPRTHKQHRPRFLNMTRFPEIKRTRFKRRNQGK